MTLAQRRMIEALQKCSAAELRRFPASGGWVETYDVTDAWNNWSAGLLTLCNASRVWQALEARMPGWVEYHPDRSTLVRPGPRIERGAL